MRTETIGQPALPGVGTGTDGTAAEEQLWQRLRGKRFEALKFQRRLPLGAHLVDLVSLERKLVVQVDGGPHLANKDADLARDRWLKAEGFTVLRFWDNEVLSNIEGVLKTIQRQVPVPVR